MNCDSYMKSNFGAHKWEFYWNTAVFLVYVLSVAAFLLEEQSWVVETDVAWL